MDVPPTRKPRVRRCLFGKPDKEEVDKWISDKLEKIDQEKRDKWGFDFVNDRPLDQGGDIHYEAVSSAEVAVVYRPRVTRNRAKPAVSLTEPSTSNEIVEHSNAIVEPENEPQLEVVEATTVVTRVTRSSSSKKNIAPGSPSSVVGGLKQAKLTNYMPVRKRRSMTQLAVELQSPTPTKRDRNEAPSSPFRFAPLDEAGSSEVSATPQKSPVKKRSARLRITGNLLARTMRSSKK